MGAGHLDVLAFTALLDANPWVAEVELSNYGEMFLNPRLIEILRIAHDRKVALHADNGVNLNHASDETLEALVEYGFRSLTCSIDGATPETYAQYRIKGDFSRVTGHLRRIGQFKRQRHSGLPLMTWQFIVFGHNEQEIAAARKLAAELGMRFRTKLSWDDEFSPIRNPELVRIETRSPHVTRAAFQQASGVDYMRGICYQLWQAPVLNWDGRVMGCCRNFWGDFGGNAFQDGLLPVLNGEKIGHARKMLTGNAPARDDIPCTTCDLYQTLKDTGRWLDESEFPNPEAGLLSVVIEATRATDAPTHADVFIVPGTTVDPVLLARPPKATRFTIGKDFAAYFTLPAAGEYTVCVLPKQLDPAFRRDYPPLPPVTKPLVIAARPVCQEVNILV